MGQRAGLMEQIIRMIGCFVGGITFIYSIYYLMNVRRMKGHTPMYARKSSIFLALGCLCISGIFLFSLLNNLISQSYAFYLRMGIIFTGMACLTMSMYYNENELLTK